MTKLKMKRRALFFHIDFSSMAWERTHGVEMGLGSVGRGGRRLVLG